MLSIEYLDKRSVLFLHNRTIMAKLMESKDAEVEKIGEWAPSSLHGKSKEAEICCNKEGTSCEPFPTCCDCTP